MPAVRLAGKSYSARQVLEAMAKYRSKAQLIENLEREPSQRSLYLRSPLFLSQAQAFANLKLLELVDVPPVTREQLLAEARAMAGDLQWRGPAEGLLAAQGLRVEWRARLLAQQPQEIGRNQLRQHMLASIPEFFGDLQISWIRLPLVTAETGTALRTDERRELYDRLDEVGQMLDGGELTWEEAVEQHAVLPQDRDRKGAVGLVNRRQTNRYEESLLRQVFRGLGHKSWKGHLLRGPIMGERWIYLVRVETYLQRGVVDLELKHQEVERSLREKMLQEKLEELRATVNREILAPIILKE